MIILKYVIHRGKGLNIFGLCGKVLFERGGFCEKLLEGSPCLMKIMPDNNKTHLPVTKSEPISDSAGTPGVI